MCRVCHSVAMARQGLREATPLFALDHEEPRVSIVCGCLYNALWKYLYTIIVTYHKSMYMIRISPGDY
jgi:hypothetical protein